MKKAELMAGIPLFRKCTKRELARISALSERLMAEPGEVLAREGTSGDLFFVIERGEAEVTVGGKRVAKLTPGGFFGEIALLDALPRTASVTATTSMVLHAVKAKDFGAFLDESPSVVRSLLRTVSERLREAESAPTYNKMCV